MAAAAGPTLISSVQRALNLLDLVGESSGPVTAKALARRARQPLPTTYHLLRTLVHEGYLRRIEGVGYVLGDRITALSDGQGGVVARAARYRSILSRVFADMHAATYLAVYDDGAIRLADIVDSPQIPRVDLWVGLQESAHATALGKAVLAALDDDSRREYVTAHDVPDLTPRTITDRRALLRQLDAVSGPAYDMEEYALDTACVAVAARSHTFLGAIAISFRAEHLKQVAGRLHVLQRASQLVSFASAA